MNIENPTYFQVENETKPLNDRHHVQVLEYILDNFSTFKEQEIRVAHDSSISGQEVAKLISGMTKAQAVTYEPNTKAHILVGKDIDASYGTKVDLSYQDE